MKQRGVTKRVCQFWHTLAGDDKVEANGQGIYDHGLHVELQFLSRPRSNASDTDAHKLHELAADDAVEEFELIKKGQEEFRYWVTCWNRQVHHDFQNQDDIDAATENVVYLLLLLCFFCCHVNVL